MTEELVNLCADFAQCVVPVAVCNDLLAVAGCNLQPCNPLALVTCQAVCGCVLVCAYVHRASANPHASRPIACCMQLLCYTCTKLHPPYGSQPHKLTGMQRTDIGTGQERAKNGPRTGQELAKNGPGTGQEWVHSKTRCVPTESARNGNWNENWNGNWNGQER